MRSQQSVLSIMIVTSLLTVYAPVIGLVMGVLTYIWYRHWDINTQRNDVQRVWKKVLIYCFIGALFFGGIYYGVVNTWSETWFVGLATTYVGLGLILLWQARKLKNLTTGYL